MQAKLLRVLDDSTFRPLDGTEEMRLDVRVLAATHRDLVTLVRQRRFQEDLLYRLGTITMEVPPLRERTGDVARLARYFVERLNTRYGARKALAPDTVAALEQCDWPGNVRQLLHEIESAYFMSEGACILPGHLSVSGRQRDRLRVAADGERLPMLEVVERTHLERALHLTRGHRARTAEVLGISERTLYRMLLKYGLAD